MVGGKLPTDRIIDGVDRSDFMLGNKQKSNRESVVVYVGNDIYGVKWRNWKMMTKEIEHGAGEPVKEFPVPTFYNLHLDPREENPTLNAPENLWVRYPASQLLVNHAKSLQQEPPIPLGAPDPYTPTNR